jgi:hypothetical protein
MIEEQVNSNFEYGSEAPPSEATIVSVEPELVWSGDENATLSINRGGDKIEAESDDVEASSDESTDASESDEDIDEGSDDRSQEDESGEEPHEDAEPASNKRINPTLPRKKPRQMQCRNRMSSKTSGAELEKQPYKFEQCTVQIAIQLLPDDGRRRTSGHRRRSLALDAPIVRAISLNDLGSLPPVITGLLDELKSELPKRDLHAREAFEQKRLEKMKRKSRLAGSTTHTTEHANKATKRQSLSDAPAATASEKDNRPRPDVKVPMSTQRQIGLF